MFEAEGVLWAAIEMLSAIEHSGTFAGRIEKTRKDISAIAAEMRTYNDQFEVPE
jgi:hypothetical protein